MNNKHILDLTLRLSQALDQNYDVVSMETVLSVISALEGTTITKEQLEATRLAKYINQLRRRTKCENLARRAKSLLKRWREMVGMQQAIETVTSTSVASVLSSTAITSISTPNATPLNMPVSDNAVSTNPQFTQRQHQQSNFKHQIQEQPYHSQPSSPVITQERSNPNEFLISMSNPATSSQIPKSSNSNVRKKRRIEKNIRNEPVQQPPISFANLITGLGSIYAPSRKTNREKNGSVVTPQVKPVETFVIEHSSNSNSDLICIPSNTFSSNITSATDVPPVVIDLQDTNSSMNSLVSKDVTNASSSFYRNKTSSKKSKKEKKRKDRNLSLHNPPLQDCDDQNTVTMSCHKRPSDVLLLDEKSHSACPTISNISEILSLSNSSMSSVFPSTDAMTKNIFQSGENELVPSLSKMSKSDLTFAGKFKQSTSSATTSCNVLNYNSDNMKTNISNNNSPNQEKFSLFGGIGTNSNDSSSSSRTSSYHAIDNTGKREASNSRHNTDDGIVKHDINEKSTSNMSNKGNSSTDNAFILGASNMAAAQHQQSIDLTTNEFSSQQTVKQPKKRGRKKGSKGVDSVIAKEASLSSQMLISTLGVTGKKVKTTKELYAEMENRKLSSVKQPGLEETFGNSPHCGEQHPQKSVSSRRTSFCSDIADSDSCTMTSEPSRDSGNNIVIKSTIGKRDTPCDNNSNFSKHDSVLKTDDVKSDENCKLLTDENSYFEITSRIKHEIQDILKLLPPPPSVKEIEYECFNSTTPCTCTIEEVTAPAETECSENVGDNNSKDLSFNASNSMNNTENASSNHLWNKTEQMANITEDNLKNVDNDQKDILPQPPAKVKKSIFDLDFDDDEDPLNSIIADIVGKDSKTEMEIKISPLVIENKCELPASTEVDSGGKVDHQNALYALSVPTPSDNVGFPSYEVKFDPDCKAKNRFEIQTQKITKFHIDTLHNCFIPNVNGNWNYTDSFSTRSRIKVEDNAYDETALVTDGYGVVPLYGTNMSEQIAKDLSHIKFTKRFKVKHPKCQNKNEILFHIPFIGVSRLPDVDVIKMRSKVLKKLKLEEEKENVDNKLNLNNNMILNISALETNDAKERGEIKVEGVQNLEANSNTINLKTIGNINKSDFKRIKKHATLVKRSTIKRLKLAVNGNNSETHINNSDDSNSVDEYKLHKTLFYSEELYPRDRSGSSFHNECIFHISSCSSGCSSADEEIPNEFFFCRKHTTSTSSSPSSSSSSEYHMLNLQQEIIQTELTKMVSVTSIENNKNESAILENDGSVDNISVSDIYDDHDDNEDNDLPEENNRMLLSFNNIYNKCTRDENAEQQNKDHENNVLKQQLQNCDDYNNFNLIRYIDNKTSSVNNVNNNNNDSCSNNCPDKTNINISSSSCTHDNPTNSALVHHQHHNNNANPVQIKPFKEYQTGIRAVDEDVDDDDGNNCGRLQQFKEWHEVLQLRSFNDELLTVLPYVVLE